MKYFAYGSNMSLLRLRERVPSAERLGVFKLEQHVLRFHKIGIDGSGKCDAFLTEDPNASVIGALFEIDKEAGIKDAKELASELALLLEGSTVTAQVSEQSDNAAETAKHIAGILIENAIKN